MALYSFRAPLLSRTQASLRGSGRYPTFVIVIPPQLLVDKGVLMPLLDSPLVRMSIYDEFFEPGPGAGCRFCGNSPALHFAMPYRYQFENGTIAPVPHTHASIVCPNEDGTPGTPTLYHSLDEGAGESSLLSPLSRDEPLSIEMERRGDDEWPEESWKKLSYDEIPEALQQFLYSEEAKSFTYYCELRQFSSWLDMGNEHDAKVILGSTFRERMTNGLWRKMVKEYEANGRRTRLYDGIESCQCGGDPREHFILVPEGTRTRENGRLICPTSYVNITSLRADIGNWGQPLNPSADNIGEVKSYPKGLPVRLNEISYRNSIIVSKGVFI